MNDLDVIARDMRVSADVLKRPAELLKQGYQPAFLGTYRLDELGQMDTNMLARLKRGLEHRDKLAKFKEKIKAQGDAEGWWTESIQPFLDQAQSIAEIDGVTRNIRSRKSSRLLAQKNPKPAELGQAILTMTGSPPENLEQWAAQQAGIDLAEAGKLLHETKQWLQVLLSEDAALIYKLGRQILKRSQISVTLLADQPEKPETDETAHDEVGVGLADTVTATVDVSSEQPASHESESATAEAALAAAYADAPTEEISSESSANDVTGPTDSTSESELAHAESAESVSTTQMSTEPSAEAAAIDPLLSFPNKASGTGPLGKIVAAKKKIQTVSLKQLSPRQRRRRWLRSILQRYSKMKKPLHKLSHYQALMLGRGQRSQIISLKMDYDHQAMTRLAREAFCPGNHPLHGFLTEVADEALKKSILPKLEHDVFAEVEEAAHGELIEMAVRHLQEMLNRRPVRGHRILVIDAMGPKTAAIAIVDPLGQVEYTGDLSSVSSRPDVVTQNVTALGQLIHQYKVSLVALSNGNTRRYLIHTVNELMKQSGEGGLRWTIVDRTGADSYCENRQSLHELPRISKRHRAAVWLAWRLQDPLIELTKVDPARLRLGSYQRELPQDVLEDALTDAVSTSVAARGVDVWNSHEKSLVCLPGVDKALSRAIVALRDAGQITTREALATTLKEKTSESQLRQAIGYLRVFESEQPLDGTMIHPEDYRLAERLIAAGQLTAPASAPQNWKKPKLASDSTQPENTEAVAVADSNAEATVSPNENPSEESSAVSELVVAEASEAPQEATAPPVEASVETASDTPDDLAASETSVSVDAAAPTADAPQEAATISPENPTEPTAPPALTIDVERLARSWQVGREKMRMVARCLQQPFSDSRDAHMPIPLLTHVPTLESLKPGMTAWGIVVGVADFGAFVDLGPDCNGLIHVSRLSKDFVEDPHEVAQMGDLLQVWVINVDLDKKRIALSALPPGVEQTRRPSHHDQDHDQSGRGQHGRGPQSDRQQGNRPRYNERGGDQRSGGPNQRPRDGQSQNRPSGDQRGGGQAGGGQGQPRFGSNQGQQGGQRGAFSGGRGRNDRGGSRGDRRNEGQNDEGSQARNEQRQARQNKPAKPAPPITEAMQQGIEPMRTFGDLLQFYQVKREEPAKPTKVAPTTSEAPTPDAATPTASEPVSPSTSAQTNPSGEAPANPTETESNAT